MKKNFSPELTISLLIIAFLIGTMVGFAFTPEYVVMKDEEKEEMMELGNADRYLDLRYVDGLIAHHLSAIDMSEQALLHSKRLEIRSLGETIIELDSKGIEQLYQYKKEWFDNTREIKQFQKVYLGEPDEKFDLRFLNSMMTHHEQAIAMAQEVKTKSQRTEVLNIADEVLSILSPNLEQLKAWRKEWYGV